MSYPLEGLPIDEREVLAQANELFVVRGQWTVEQVGLEALSDYVAVEDKTRLPAGVVTAVNRAEENLIQLLLAHNEPVEGYAYVPYLHSLGRLMLLKPTSNLQKWQAITFSGEADRVALQAGIAIDEGDHLPHMTAITTDVDSRLEQSRQQFCENVYVNVARMTNHLRSTLE